MVLLLRVLRLLGWLLVAEVELLLASAFRRMTLYEEAYGFTTARLYGQVFMGGVAVLLAGQSGANAQARTAPTPTIGPAPITAEGVVLPTRQARLSFKQAGRKAFQAAMEKASPILLEPIMHVDITAPQEYAGDIMGDLNGRRGRVQGMDAKGNQQVIKAQVPQSEMLTYQSTLNSITQARGSFHMEFSHYDEVPRHLIDKVVAEAKKAEEEHAK